MYDQTTAKMPDQEKIVRVVILEKTEDWDSWYMIVRTAADVAKV